jgi:hypothetical protein
MSEIYFAAPKLGRDAPVIYLSFYFHSDMGHERARHGAREGV